MAPIMPQISMVMAVSLTLLTRSPASAFTFAPSSASRVFPALLSPRCQPSPGARASFSGAPARPGAALGAEQGRTAGGGRNAARRHGMTAVNMAVAEVVDELVQLTNPGLEVLHAGDNPGANLKSISHRCHLREVAVVWEFTKETIDLPLGCLQGGGEPIQGYLAHKKPPPPLGPP